MADISIYVSSENTASERRITPSWSISELKSKLETVTGIPPSSQKLQYVAPSGQVILLEPTDQDNTLVASYALDKSGEIKVIDTRPAAARPNLADLSQVEKYVMPEEEYEKKEGSVLAYKKAHQIGRFDPNAPKHAEAKRAALVQEVQDRQLAVGKRCRVGEEDARRGIIQYVGPVPEITGSDPESVWIGVQLDEPVGKNDGSLGGTRYWSQPGQDESSTLKHGVFVRPDRVEAGDFPVLDDLEELEEI